MDNEPIFEPEVIDLTPRRKRKKLWIALAIIVALFLFGSPLLTIYIDSLWFASTGYSAVYWYKFKLGGWLFLLFLVASFLLIRLPFFWLNRVLPALTEKPRVRLASIQDMRDINLLPIVYRPGVWILSAAVALLSASSMSQQWATFALYLHGATTATSDPVFHRDAGFYLFKLPALELVADWFLTLAALLFVVTALLSLYVNYIEKARGANTSRTNKQSLLPVNLAAAVLALALAMELYLNRFDMLTATHDLFSGASYSDVNVRLMGMTVLIVALLLAALLLILNGLVMRRGRVIIWTLGGLAAIWLIGVIVLPQTIHTFSVKPNELAKESPYIQANINATRHAFAIDGFEERAFQPTPTLTAQQVQANQQTLDNVRLWDRGALQAVLGQIQEIRTYYEFKIPDVDRYQINGQPKQVLIAAREMNVDQLPEQSRNWINQHIVYTHGYGVAMTTVNGFTSEGSPNFILKNMPVESSAPEIKITRPEIYFGESTNSHVYVRTKSQSATLPEFNYPAEGNNDSYTQYEGQAGIPVGGLFRKLALAAYLGDGSNLLFSDYFKDESLLLMRRNVRDRVKEIAPFLLFEEDPYIVIGKDGKLYWIIDGFTYSDRYPYSTEYRIANREVNYLRNSVKAVVDAYDGTAKFYVFDAEDAMIQSYRNIFPSLFLPSSEMPKDLREHIRYPSFQLNAQAAVYTLYHIQNTQTFYNHEDLWAIATDEVANTETGKTEATPMRSYHLLMQLPGEKKNMEFVNILPFTPAGQGRNNMIGWVAARSDGDNYGHMLVFSFPKNVTVNGPTQIRARVNQDPQLSAQMTLWNQKGSRLLRGQLLVIPIADTLLYVEPFYLQAENSPMPELRQVAIATQEKLAAGKTFEEALNLLVPELAAQRNAAALPPAASAKSSTEKLSTEKLSTEKLSTGQPMPLTGEMEKLARQAQQLILDYERLTAEGKHREAGEKLDQLKQTLNELAKKRNGG
ncbi:MAG: UPF0182 family protein [Acidobacteria bacterium]|nr:UPF0182 family protein [Acidobacteriota bacterium]